MNVLPLQSAISPLREQGEFGVQHWLDELVAGNCSQDEFLYEVHAMEAHLPQVVWEVLALLDQYYRRRKITLRDFMFMKTLLQRSSLGFVDDAAVPVLSPLV